MINKLPCHNHYIRSGGKKIIILYTFIGNGQHNIYTHTHPECLKFHKSHFTLCVYCRLLELGLEGKVIRSQDLSSLVLMIAKNPQGTHLAWNFVKKNWDTLVQKCVQHFAESVNNVRI